MENIVILDGYVANDGDIPWDGLKELGTLTVYERTAPEEVVKRLQEATAVFTNKVLLKRDVLEQLPNLKFIGVLATGYNNVDIEAAHELGITVCNVPAYSTESVVQTVFSHLLNIVNRVADHVRSVRNGDWQFCNDFSYRLGQIEELAGMTIGIYGLGNIGKRVAEIANAFRMKVIALTSKEQDQLPDYITKVDSEEFFRQSDVISLNAPLTEKNKYFINRDTIAKMKPGVIIINTARGGLIDEAALDEALSEGRIHAAGLDVLSAEPPVNGNPLIENEQCFVTPHIAWQSTTARRKLIDISVENLRRFTQGTPINKI